jgi:hypothetical protein
LGMFLYELSVSGLDSLAFALVLRIDRVFVCLFSGPSHALVIFVFDMDIYFHVKTCLSNNYNKMY